MISDFQSHYKEEEKLSQDSEKRYLQCIQPVKDSYSEHIKKNLINKADYSREKWVKDFIRHYTKVDIQMAISI